ncbi:12050_t:CDS:2, partial [Racocetra fulgida]
MFEQNALSSATVVPQDVEMLCASQETVLLKSFGRSQSVNLDEEFDNYVSSKKKFLTVDDFNYSIKMLDKKITSLYQLCHFVATKQKEISKNIKKLIAFEELSDKKYLAENAEHFIDTIGKTTWVSYFNEKLLPE